MRGAGWKAQARGTGYAAVVMGAALLAGHAWGQPVPLQPVLLDQAAGRIIHEVALEGEAAPGGRFESVGTARVNRQGDIGFFATVARETDRRRGLFAWLRGPVEVMVREGEPTGRGPLLLPDSSEDWAWSDGPRAVFLGAADSNGNGTFDPGIDPQFLFLATRDRLTRLIRIGDPLDGGTLLSIRSFRLTDNGQVAILALVDRNGDAQYAAGTDTAGIYGITGGRAEVLAREGERIGDGRLRGLDTAGALDWSLNNRGEAVLRAGLDRRGDPNADEEAIFVVSRPGDRLVARTGLRTPFGTIRRLGAAALSNQGEVIYPATLSSDTDAEFGLFRSRTSAAVDLQDLLVPPGDVGPAGALIRQIIPSVRVNDLGLVAFCGTFAQDLSTVEGVVTDPFACFILAPEALYEVVREGDLNPWGRVREIQTLDLNNRGQAAVQVTVVTVPPDRRDPAERGRAILLWENGTRVGVVGPGDRVPGGRVGSDTTHLGLSDTGWLAFGATVTGDDGAARRGIFAARVSD